MHLKHEGWMGGQFSAGSDFRLISAPPTTPCRNHREGMSLAQLVSLTVPPGQQSVAMDGKGNAGKTPEKEEAFGVSAAVKAQRQQPQPTKQK